MQPAMLRRSLRFCNTRRRDGDVAVSWCGLTCVHRWGRCRLQNVERGHTMRTRKRTLILTGISAGLYLFLCWAFADGLFSGNWWNSDAIASSNIFTYLFLFAIIACGLYQAQNAPVESRPAFTQKGDAG